MSRARLGEGAASKSRGASGSCTGTESRTSPADWPNREDSENDRPRVVLAREIGHASTSAAHISRWGNPHHEPIGLHEEGWSGHVLQRAHAGVQPCRERHRNVSHDHRSVLRQRSRQAKRHHPHLRGDVHQREAVGEDLSGEGRERILRSARDTRCGGAGRCCGARD